MKPREALAHALGVLLLLAACGRAKTPRGFTLVPGAVNGAVIERGEERLIVYGDPRGTVEAAAAVLLTHHRRDVVWAARALVEGGAGAVVPAGEIAQFTDVDEYWARFQKERFHDYEQQTTKVLATPLHVERAVRGGDSFTWEDLTFEVLETPGYTRDAVSYVVDLDRETVAFTGDLIYGDGRILDIYSLQDFIPQVRGAGYHGYGARLAQTLSSLERVAAAKPDLLVPARGPVIRDPAQPIERLTGRIRALYANYLTTDALRWHFGDDHVRAKAARVLGPGATVDWMEMAETVEEALPAWLVPIQNTRLILSADGSGFLLDCGNGKILAELQRRHEEGTLTSLDHVFITHYHDDHTDSVPDLVEVFGSTVYATPEMVDVLENPATYRLPAMTSRPIRVTRELASGATWRWKEFEMTISFFPGQALLHQALLAKKDSGESVFFVGDTFSPSGLDDYCPLNRNFLHPGMGFFDCLEQLRGLPGDALLVNQHVPPAFRFSTAQVDRMESSLRHRLELLQDLVPWDDPNFALDEGWARLHPYGAQVEPGGTVQGSLVIMNHSPQTQEFRPSLNLPSGWARQWLAPTPLRIPPRTEAVARFTLSVPEGAEGLHILTADVGWSDWELREWTEMMVEVAPAIPE